MTFESGSDYAREGGVRMADKIQRKAGTVYGICSGTRSQGMNVRYRDRGR